MIETIMRQDIPRVLSQTNGRYTLSCLNDEVWDNFLNKEVKPDKENYFNILPFGKIHYHVVWLLANKPLYIDPVDVVNNWQTDNLKVLRRDDVSVDRFSLYWKHYIECRSYPGFYYVPGFTRYVINRKGQVFSLVGSSFLNQYLNAVGYPSYRMQSDGGKEHHVTIHRMLAITFKEWDINVIKLDVDHIDGDIANYSLDNLEFVTGIENRNRAIISDYYGRGRFGADENDRIYCEDMVTREIILFETMAAISRHLNLSSNSLIVHHLKRPLTTSLVKQRYLIKRIKVDKDNQPINLDIDYDDILTRVGSQTRPVLSKNIETGEIKRYDSAIEFVRDSGLSRKQVYERLKQSKQRVFVNLIFKYEDDETDWIV